jgi:2'-5' RNA ligase
MKETIGLQILFNIDFFSIYVTIESIPHYRERPFEEVFLLRSFLAIELTESILKRIGEVQRELKSLKADVRWVNPENIHLTLKFFGNIEESRIEAIVKAIEGPARNASPLSIIVRGMGAFPGLKNPRVIWAGLNDEKKVLTSFQNRLEQELEKEGFQPEDRSFHPHLTLGRVRSNRGKDELVRAIERHREEEFGSFKAERVVLFKSDLKPTGPIYTALKEVKLGI